MSTSIFSKYLNRFTAGPESDLSSQSIELALNYTLSRRQSLFQAQSAFTPLMILLRLSLELHLNLLLSKSTTSPKFATSLICYFLNLRLHLSLQLPDYVTSQICYFTLVSARITH